MRLLEKRKTGISLVALIVTIIVLIILTGAVIVTFMEDGIVDRAKDAVARNDLATLKEVYSLKYNKKKIDVDIGETEGIAELDALKEATDELKLKGFSYADGTVTYTGDNKYISEWLDSEFIYKTLTEGGYYFTKIDGKTYMTGLKAGTNAEEDWETAGDILSKLGEGYSIYDNNGEAVTEGSTKVTTGYVIKRGDTEYATIVVKGEVRPDYSMDLSDTMAIMYMIAGRREYTQAQILAADINSDGIISKDDEKNILLISAGQQFFTRDELQKTSLKPVTSKVDEYVCKWYDGTDEGYYTLVETLEENGYSIDEEEEIISLESGTTYAEVRSALLNILPADDIKFKNEEGEDIENINAPIEEGYYIVIVFSDKKIDNTTYCQNSEQWLMIAVN